MPNNYQAVLEGNQFGETYHIATASVLTRFLPPPTEANNDPLFKAVLLGTDSAGGLKMTTAQREFIQAAQRTSLLTSTAAPQKISKQQVTELIIAKTLANPEAGKVVRTGLFRQLRDNLPDQAAWLAVQDNIIKFLGTAGIKEKRPHAIVWSRTSNPQQPRDTSKKLIQQIATCLKKNNIVDIILMGDDLGALKLPDGISTYPMYQYYKNQNYRDCFKGIEIKDCEFPVQLALFPILQKNFGLAMAIGMKSGAMDGAGFMGLPTIFFDNDGPHGRMGILSTAVPHLFKQLCYDLATYDPKGEKGMSDAALANLDAAILAALNAKSTVGAV